MTLLSIGRWLRHRADDVAVLLLMVMFVSFIVQIVSRYIFNFPIGSAFELIILCWVWSVLWGAAFVTRERDEIRFDVVFSLLSVDIRRRLTIVTGIVLIVIYGVSLPAVVDYVRFMRVEKTTYLKIPFDLAYSVYVIFAVAALGRYLWLVWRALRNEAVPETLLESTQSDPKP